MTEQDAIALVGAVQELRFQAEMIAKELLSLRKGIYEAITDLGSSIENSADRQPPACLPGSWLQKRVHVFIADPEQTGSYVGKLTAIHQSGFVTDNERFYMAANVLFVVLGKE